SCLSACLVLCVSVTVPRAIGEEPPAASTEESLKNLPEFGGSEYRVDAYISAAAALQSMDKERAIECMRTLANNKEQHRRFNSVFVLCRMLFTAKPGTEFRGPHLGSAGFLGGSYPTDIEEYKDWPLEPIELVDGVPFCIVWGYSGMGASESAEQYLSYC